jgi:hypothetical protein
VNETHCRRVVWKRSNGMCELCPKLAVRMRHRRKIQGAQWTPSNILHICAEDDDWIEKNIAAASRNGWTIQDLRAVPSMTPVRRRGELALLSDCGDVFAVVGVGDGVEQRLGW